MVQCSIFVFTYILKFTVGIATQLWNYTPYYLLSYVVNLVFAIRLFLAIHVYQSHPVIKWYQEPISLMCNNLYPTGIRNPMPSNLWYEITYPFPNVNGTEPYSLHRRSLGMDK